MTPACAKSVPTGTAGPKLAPLLLLPNFTAAMYSWVCPPAETRNAARTASGAIRSASTLAPGGSCVGADTGTGPLPACSTQIPDGDTAQRLSLLSQLSELHGPPETEIVRLPAGGSSGWEEGWRET